MRQTCRPQNVRKRSRLACLAAGAAPARSSARRTLAGGRTCTTAQTCSGLRGRSGSHYRHASGPCKVWGTDVGHRAGGQASKNARQHGTTSSPCRHPITPSSFPIRRPYPPPALRPIFSPGPLPRTHRSLCRTRRWRGRGGVGVRPRHPLAAQHHPARPVPTRPLPPPGAQDQRGADPVTGGRAGSVAGRRAGPASPPAPRCRA